MVQEEAQEATEATQAPAEGDTVQDTDVDAGERENDAQRPYEDVVKDLAKVRQEAASWRTKFRQAEETLAKAKSPEDYEALAQDLAKVQFDFQKQTWLYTHASSLPGELVESIAWPDDEEGIKAKAKSLAKYAVVHPVEQELHGGLDPRNTRSEENASPGDLAKRYNRRAGR